MKRSPAALFASISLLCAGCALVAGGNAFQLRTRNTDLGSKTSSATVNGGVYEDGASLIALPSEAPYNANEPMGTYIECSGNLKGYGALSGSYLRYSSCYEGSPLPVNLTWSKGTLGNVKAEDLHYETGVNEAYIRANKTIAGSFTYDSISITTDQKRTGDEKRGEEENEQEITAGSLLVATLAHINYLKINGVFARAFLASNPQKASLVSRTYQNYLVVEYKNRFGVSYEPGLDMFLDTRIDCEAIQAFLGNTSGSNSYYVESKIYYDVNSGHIAKIETKEKGLIAPLNLGLSLYGGGDYPKAVEGEVTTTIYDLSLCDATDVSVRLGEVDQHFRRTFPNCYTEVGI